MKTRNRWGLALAGAVIVASALTLVDPGGDAARAWLAYSVVAAACAALLIVVLGSVGREAPKGVLAAVLVALALRLVVGAVLLRVLPVWGYDTDPQKAGYVYWDSYKRDTDAWNISRMDDPMAGLAAARTTSDQYLGLVTFSAGLYGVLSPDAHRPLLIIELTALGFCPRRPLHLGVCAFHFRRSGGSACRLGHGALSRGGPAGQRADA